MKSCVTARQIALILASSLLVMTFANPGALGDDLKADIDEGKKLLREGDGLADKGETTEAVIRYKKAFEQLLPGLRKLSFKTEVKRDVTARIDLQEMLIKQIDSEIGPEEFHAGELGLKALGLIPLDFDLKSMMVKIYSEEIAAFYDPKTKTMHLIKEPETKSKTPSLLERLLGRSGGFDKDENKTTIAHELTHALADQNFDIDKMQQAIKNDDDRDLALSALIEGEATLAMTGAQMNDWDGKLTSEISASTLNQGMGFLMPFMSMAGGKTLREAPIILSESMIFPYLRGMVFCATIVNQGGWDAVSEAYRRPPLSTEQILHPEKFREHPDYPMFVDFGKIEPAAGWKEVGRNVVGEMQISILLRSQGGKKAGSGWDGDRYAVFENEKHEHELGLVWLTTWDTEKDADRFTRDYIKKLGLSAKPDAADEELAEIKSVRLLRNGKTFAIEQRGQDVAIVQGFTLNLTSAFLEAAFKAKKTELTYDNVKELTAVKD